jgi:hypothetical protein
MSKFRNHLGVFAGALVLLLGFGPATAGASTATTGTPASPTWAAAVSPVPLNSFPVKVRHTGMCLEVDNGSFSPGARVLQFPCHGGPHQKWFAFPQPDGSFRLAAEHSLQCLEIDHGSSAEGAGILQWPCHDGAHQKWDMVRVPVEGNFVRIKSRHSGMCLEVFNASTAAAAPVVQFTCHLGTHQQWSS